MFGSSLGFTGDGNSRSLIGVRGGVAHHTCARRLENVLLCVRTPMVAAINDAACFIATAPLVVAAAVLAKPTPGLLVGIWATGSAVGAILGAAQTRNSPPNQRGWSMVAADQRPRVQFRRLERSDFRSIDHRLQHDRSGCVRLCRRPARRINLHYGPGHDFRDGDHPLPAPRGSPMASSGQAKAHPVQCGCQRRPRDPSFSLPLPL